MKTKVSLLLISIIYCNLAAQTAVKTNLDVINSLIDKSMQSIITGLPFEDIAYYMKYDSAPEYSFMNSRAKSALSKLVSVTEKKDKALYNISYTIEQINTSYRDAEKTGLFGSYKVTRKISLKGSYILENISTSIKSDEFEFTSTDTVEYDSIDDLELMTLPFTRGKKPDEPFFASLLEPAIALGAIAVTVILFFTVRSN